MTLDELTQKVQKNGRVLVDRYTLQDLFATREERSVGSNHPIEPYKPVSILKELEKRLFGRLQAVGLACHWRACVWQVVTRQ